MDTDISVLRLAGLKESSRSRVKNPFLWNLPKGNTFCFANARPVNSFSGFNWVGKVKSLCVSSEYNERATKKIELVSLGLEQVYPLLGIDPKPRPFGFGLLSPSDIESSFKNQALHLKAIATAQ
jgi:hypothetical protein